MPVYKNEDNGTWYVLTRYLDWKDERKQKCKRGFETKREAQEWERVFQQQSAADMDMNFAAFVELYIKDMKPRLKENTWLTKKHIIETKILPYFEKKNVSEITTKDVIAWQNELLAFRDEKKKPYSQTYLKTVHNQLIAIFNHAVRHYDLRSNPAAKAGNMGTEERKKMKFWTKEEYKKFADEMMDKPVSYYAFEMLYWCGIREGELLALTAGDFDFEKSTVTISKSYQRLHGEDVITTPKTKKSNRTIKMPQFLCEEMQDYIGMLYGYKNLNMKGWILKMSAKNLDRHNRWRSKTIAFRMSPQKADILDSNVRLSGLTKQDYLCARAMQQQITVIGNPRVYKALRNELSAVLDELKRIEAGAAVHDDLLDRIDQINTTLYGMKERKDGI